MITITPAKNCVTIRPEKKENVFSGFEIAIEPQNADTGIVESVGADVHKHIDVNVGDRIIYERHFAPPIDGVNVVIVKSQNILAVCN